MDRLTDIIKYREYNDTEALNRLINNELDRVELSIERFKHIGIEYNDLKSIAILTIIRIANNYDYKKYGNTYFRSRVDIGIDRAFEDLSIKQLKKEQFLKENKKNNIKTDVFQDDTFDRCMENITKVEVLKSLEVLTDYQRTILYLRYGLLDGIERTL